jgi:hypothetical protein
MSDILIVVLFCTAYVSFVVFYTSYVVGYNISRRSGRKKFTSRSLFD